MKYYVYIYLNPLKPGNYKYKKFNFDHEPFYVGIGKGSRINQHIRNARYNKIKSLKDNIILKILRNDKEPIRYKLYENITLGSSLRLEKCLIKLIGRRNLGNGTLSNLTDGGEGCLNIIVSDELREKISIRNRILWKNGTFDKRDIRGEKNGFYNKHHSRETKEKLRILFENKYKGISNPNFNNKWTDEMKKNSSIRQKENHKHLVGDNNPSKREDVRKKLSETKIGLKNPNAKKWLLKSPDGKELIIEGGIKRNLKLYNLDYQQFEKMENNERKNKKGWILKEIDFLY